MSRKMFKFVRFHLGEKSLGRPKSKYPLRLENLPQMKSFRISKKNADYPRAKNDPKRFAARNRGAQAGKHFPRKPDSGRHRDQIPVGVIS